MTYEAAAKIDMAADHIEKYGHHKGSAFGTGSDGLLGTAPMCVLGALAHYCVFKEGREALRAIVAPTQPLDWNDDPSRTKQEVLDVLRLAAKQERIAEDGTS